MSNFTAKLHQKIDFGWAVLRPRWGAYSVPQIP